MVGEHRHGGQPRKCQDVLINTCYVFNCRVIGMGKNSAKGGQFSANGDAPKGLQSLPREISRIWFMSTSDVFSTRKVKYMPRNVPAVLAALGVDVDDG